MQDLYARVRKYIQEKDMIRRGEAVVAGVSGGADSLCLFRVLLRLSGEEDFFLHVVHVHHGLRDTAEGDRLFVEKLCREAGVPCTSVRTDAAAMAASWGVGVEEAGRRFRYEAFEKTGAAIGAARGTGYRIAVAHHREDQAETVLFHLCRGTDLRGAGGMQPVRGRLIRPLLHESRASIEEWLLQQGLHWREDETNADTGYTRNYLRHEILPRLREGVSPASAGHIARFADACREAERYLTAVTEEALGRCLLPNRPVLILDALHREDPYIRDRILYCFLSSCIGSRDLGLVHVEALRNLCSGSTDGTLSMPGGMQVFRAGGCVFFRDEPEELLCRVTGQKGLRPPDRKPGQEGPVFPLTEEAYTCRCLPFDGDTGAIPQNLYTKWFDYDKIGAFPVFRTRQPGDRMTLSHGNREGAFSKKVSRIMLDAGIPAILRDRIVLPFCGKEALWIPGVRMGDAYKVGPRTERILEISVSAGRLPGEDAPE